MEGKRSAYQRQGRRETPLGGRSWRARRSDCGSEIGSATEAGFQFDFVSALRTDRRAFRLVKQRPFRFRQVQGGGPRRRVELAGNNRAHEISNPAADQVRQSEQAFAASFTRPASPAWTVRVPRDAIVKRNLAGAVWHWDTELEAPETNLWRAGGTRSCEMNKLRLGVGLLVVPHQQLHKQKYCGSAEDDCPEYGAGQEFYEGPTCAHGDDQNAHPQRPQDRGPDIPEILALIAHAAAAYSSPVLAPVM